MTLEKAVSAKLDLYLTLVTYQDHRRPSRISSSIDFRLLMSLIRSSSQIRLPKSSVSIVSCSESSFPISFWSTNRILRHISPRFVLIAPGNLWKHVFSVLTKCFSVVLLYYQVLHSDWSGTKAGFLRAENRYFLEKNSPRPSL